MGNYGSDTIEEFTPGGAGSVFATTSSAPYSLASGPSVANPSASGQPVTFTATVAANPPVGTPTGTVQFQVDGTNFGSPVTLVGGSATSSADSSLSVGAHTITTIYSGDSNFTTSTNSLTQPVSQDSATTTVTSTANPSVFGQSVSVTATVAANPPGSGTPTGTVQFQIDGTNFGSRHPGGRQCHQRRHHHAGGDDATRSRPFTAAITTSAQHGTLTQTVNPDVLVVTNTSDSGPGSLRQAIQNADASPGIPTIDFDIPGSGVLTISPASALPAITNQVTIDGTSQRGYSGTPLIELSGPVPRGGVRRLDDRGLGATVPAGWRSRTSTAMESPSPAAQSGNTIGGTRPAGAMSSPPTAARDRHLRLGDVEQPGRGQLHRHQRQQRRWPGQRR